MKRLRLMLVALACLLGTVLAQKTFADTTVYFQKPDGWDGVWIYYWMNSPEWPGIKLDKITGKTYDDKDVWKYTFQGDNLPDGMIFTDGKDKGSASQTTDINKSYITDGAIWILGAYNSTNGDRNRLHDYSKKAAGEWSFDTTNPPTPPTPGNVNPDGPRTIYMSFGQERILEGDRDVKPRIHFGTGSIDPDNDPEMTKVYSIEGGYTMDDPKSPVWRYTMTDDQYDTGDAILYFKLNGSDGYKQYNIGHAGNRDKYDWTKYIYYADPSKTGDTGYVSADESKNSRDRVARQSYITFEQFNEVREATKEWLYITGEGFKLADGTQEIKGWAIRPKKDDASDSDNEVMKLKGQNGVFIATITKSAPDGTASSSTATPTTALPDNETGEQHGAKFKMGWIRPYDWCEKNYGKDTADNDINEDRCWATFNLGIVGIDEAHSAINAPGEIYEDKVTIVRGEADGLNQSVFCTPGRTIPVSRYNQSDWFIRDKYIGAKDGDTPVYYTLVVDLEPTCNTVTLLYFNPDPVLTASGVVINHADLNDLGDTGMEAVYTATSDKFNAEAVNGKVRPRYVNVATAKGALKFADYGKTAGKSPAGLTYNFKSSFEVYSGENLAGEYKAPELSADNADRNKELTVELSLPGVALGDSAALGARARFEAPSKLHFHSHFQTKTIQYGGETALPGLISCKASDEKSYSYGSNHTGDPKQGKPAEESWYTLGAYARIEVEAPATNLYWYGDFRLECPASDYHNDNPELANGGEIVGPGHHTTTLSGNVKGQPLSGYTPWTEGTAYTDANNWAACMTTPDADGKLMWPVHLPEVVKVTRKYADDATGYWDFTEEGIAASLEVKGTFYAVYPFLLQPEANITTAAETANAPRRAPGSKITLDKDIAYKLSYEPVGTQYTFALTSGELTGVKDIITGAADKESEEEYYNIQGVRMRGELAPGMYIRRRGASVEKVIIR